MASLLFVSTVLLVAFALTCCGSVNAQAQRSNLRTSSSRRHLNEPPPSCTDPVIVNFDTAANGTVLPPGLYVEAEWWPFGLLLSATGGVGNLPRLFDTQNPRGPDNTGGDPDLGAPNSGCGGPGIGNGGKPGEEGENCAPLGNVLIIQEDNDFPEIPDDNRNGGIITFDFPVGVFVYEMALLDIDDGDANEVVAYESPVEGEGLMFETISVPDKGDNSFQIVPIMIDQVRSIRCDFKGSGAVAWIKFCPVKPPNTFPPTSTPSLSPTPAPVGTGPPSSDTCTSAKISFQYAADGTPLRAGDYVENEWQDYGLTLAASGGFGSLPRLFDSAVYRDPDSMGGDSDLGAPNQACKPPGPGRGSGGAPGMEGVNCDPLGNVLIIQEPGSDVPDDNRDGGELLFSFDPPATLVGEIGLLDIEEATRVWVKHVTQFGDAQTLFDVPQLGDNSKQSLEINLENVKQVTVDLGGSGAVTFLSFCYDESALEPGPPIAPPTNAVTSPPTVSPTASPIVSPTASPTVSPTASPTGAPTSSPTISPTSSPTVSPTASPTGAPTSSPTSSPTGMPTADPTMTPTASPTDSPTISPTPDPTASPTASPTSSPTASPTASPTNAPTSSPTGSPTAFPTGSPTAGPTRSPTASPTAAPTLHPSFSPSIATPAPSDSLTPFVCSAEQVTIDFETAADGTPLRPGLYVENEWNEYGLTLSAEGGLGELPRLLDSANPWVEDTGGDRDLGAPNWRCTPPGPGRGSGGAPGMPGENCDFLGNVLIIQEEDTSVPDDNFQGGTITFDFDEPVEYVSSMGLLDIDEEPATVEVSHIADGGLETTVIAVPQLGDNSKQTLDIGIEQVTQIKLNLERSGAVTFLSFCTAVESTAPYVLDFETTADGTSIPSGAYLETEWEELGVTLSAVGGFGSLPRALDSANPGEATAVGSPNERCAPSGPGIGEAGEPDMQGANCDPLDNVLIIQAVGDPLVVAPSKEAGMIMFEFEPAAPRVYEIGLLNVKVATILTVMYMTDEGMLIEKDINMFPLGENSYQTVEIGVDNVKMLTVPLEMAGAIAFLSFDPPLDPSTPTAAPVAVPSPTPFPPIDMSMSMSMSMVIDPTPSPATPSPIENTRMPIIAEPSKSPTVPPVVIVPTASPVATAPIQNVTVTCDTSDEGVPLEPGTYLENEYEKFGLILSASGGFGSLPRVFDTANPTCADGGGDPDLGTPNEACTPSGPGIGAGGAPGMPGENCDSLGNVLIIQSPGRECPDDNASGGTITFDFFKPAKIVYAMGFLDIDYETTVDVEHTSSSGGRLTTTFDLPLLGDNSVQTLQIDIAEVVRINVNFSRSGAVTFVSFACVPDVVPSPPPTIPPVPTLPAPTPAPLEPPVATPSPSKSPVVTTTVNFNVTPDGTTVPAGAYVEEEWEEYGLTLSAVGGFGTLPRIVNSENPGEAVTALGSPNERCTPAGPGVGEAGEPDMEGSNCKALGNVLVVQSSSDTETPNNNEFGGMITFSFDPIAETVYELELLNVNAPTTITVFYTTDSGEKMQRTLDARVLGTNSYQTVAINIDNVSTIAVNFLGTGAVASISFDYIPSGGVTPTPAPAVETLPPTFAEMSMSMSMSMSMPMVT